MEGTNIFTFLWEGNHLETCIFFKFYYCYHLLCTHRIQWVKKMFQESLRCSKEGSNNALNSSLSAILSSLNTPSPLFPKFQFHNWKCRNTPLKSYQTKPGMAHIESKGNGNGLFRNVVAKIIHVTVHSKSLTGFMSLCGALDKPLPAFTSLCGH